MTANTAAHTDARASVVPCKGHAARAGGCERYAATKPSPQRKTALVDMLIE